jgi:hypothetical protein
MAHIKADIDTKKFMRDLAKIHGGLNQAHARTINNIGQKTINRYNKALKSEFTVRTQFTLNALRMYKATWTSKSKPGSLRPIRNINALLFISKMKGGAEHYLALQEEGAQKSLQKSANNTVSLPMDNARKGGNFSGSISPKYRLTKNAPKDLRFRSGANRNLSTGRGYSDKQRWAIVNKYKSENPYGWDMTQPFKLEYDGNIDAYAKKGNRIALIRRMRRKNQRIKKRPLFENTLNQITEAEMQNIFNTVAGRILR